MKEEENKWKKITKIIIIIVILEHLIFLGLYSIGSGIVEKEEECSINVCNNYDSYYYETYSKMCYCYKDNGEEYKKYLGT